MNGSRVAEIFAPGGVLARLREGYEVRDGQRRMAEAVARAMAEGRHLVVEAGTGTGKSLAYLVPAFLVHEQVILSTGTRALQEQLVAREVPLAAAVTGRQRRVVLLKGRENYLCRKRLEELAADPLLPDMDEARVFREILRWADRTETGDRAEVPALPDGSWTWARVDGRADTCTGSACPHYADCFVYRARRQALEAGIVVVNHHLLFADLALRGRGEGMILPPAPFLVLDEAHLAEDAAASHFAVTLTTRRIVDLARDAERELVRAGRDPGAARAVEATGRELLGHLRPPDEAGRVRFEAGRFGAGLAERADLFRECLEGLARALEGPGERADERALLVARCHEVGATLDELLGPVPGDRVVTVEPQGRHGALLASWPIEVGPLLERTLGEAFTSVVATSATLSVARSLDRARMRLGLPGAETLVVPSPFSHRRQAVLYVPREFPEPSAPGFLRRCLDEMEELVRITEGRALLLFASHRALRRAAERLAGRLPWPVLVQGEAPRERLVEAFRADEHSVLLGTASFRQGIDVPGAALSLVVVDKLPFAVPSDPLVAARADAIRARGGNPFLEESLPEAILSLRQALGRLIRRRSDRGILALLDVRVRTRRYGRAVLESLPPWPVVADVEEVRRAWRS